MTRRRRFIAGAVCPRCREVDRLVIEGEGDRRLRRCVACGFSEAACASSVPAPTPTTRFTRSQNAAENAAPVRIIDPAKPKT